MRDHSTDDCGVQNQWEIGTPRPNVKAIGQAEEMVESSPRHHLVVNLQWGERRHTSFSSITFIIREKIHRFFSTLRVCGSWEGCGKVVVGGVDD